MLQAYQFVSPTIHLYTSISMKEIRSLTGIRGIAALYVAIYHSMHIQNYTGNSISQIFLNNGYLSVDLFFILSGYVMTLSYRKNFEGNFTKDVYYQFMRKRFARIYPMYFIVLCIGFIVLNHFAGKLNFIIGLTLLSAILANNYVVYHLWSLNAEWTAYLSFPIFIKVVYAKQTIFWSLLLTMIAMGGVLWAIQLDPGGTIQTGSPLLRCFSAYMLGVIACKIGQQWPGIISALKRFSLLLAGTIVLLLCFSGTEAIIIFLSFLLIIAISTDTDAVGQFMASKPVYFLGTISYSLYLIHPFFVDILESSYTYVTGDSWIFVGNCIYILITILLSYLAYTYIEKPAQRLLNQRLSPYRSSIQ